MPNASGRRYRQAINLYRHLDKRSRPKYRRKDAATSARHLQKVISTQRRIQAGSRKKK